MRVLEKYQKETPHIPTYHQETKDSYHKGIVRRGGVVKGRSQLLTKSLTGRMESSFLRPKDVLDYNDKVVHGWERVVEQAKGIARLGVDWNGDDFEKPSLPALELALKFVKEYGAQLSRGKKVLIPPFFEPMPDGEISVGWDVGLTKFLIIFDQNSSDAFYYGENKYGKPIRSQIDTSRALFDKTLFSWFSDNLVTYE